MLINGDPGETFNGIVTFFGAATAALFSSLSGIAIRVMGRQVR
ncbi:hypothetical protein [Nitrosospira multiformis]|nr:hypothetical protein [Nitrosospira multiformis]